MLRRAGFLVSALALAPATITASASGPTVRLTVSPSPSYALEPTGIEVHAVSGASVTRLRVRALAPSGAVSRVRTQVVGRGLRRGTFRFPVAGAWRLIVTDRAGEQVHGAGARTVRVLAPRPTPPPRGFGAVGAPGCSPASPLDPNAKGTPDIYGTALAGERLWALPDVPEGAAFARRDRAVFDGLVGKEIKIIFGMTAFHAPFRALGPSGQVLDPTWGPSFHSSSNWDRQPGVEWGAGFVFPVAGCWRIETGAFGAVYLSIRS